MYRIDRYILELFFAYLLAGLLVFVTLFVAADFISFGLKFADAGSGPLIRYYLYQTPSIIYQLLPVACLMATLFTLSGMNRHNEITALFSLGIGFTRIVSTIFAAVAVVSVVAFVLSDQLLPRLLQKKNYVEYVEIRKRPGLYSTVKTNKIWYRSENILYNIKTVDPQNQTAQGITLYYFDPSWNLTQLIAADQVVMKGNLWDLKRGLVTLFVAESSFPLTKSFENKTITMNDDLKDIQSTSNSSDIMTLKELRRFIERNKEAGLDTLRYEVDYQTKFGFAFASLVMSVMGAPFSLGRQRSGGMFLNIGICLGIAFGYWILYSSGLTLGKHGYIPPFWGAWGPNLIAVLFSWLLIRRLRR